ncbi:MAG: DNA-3-methyladenine glycosylase 2 family protein [Gemmatimonadota bacterium]
MKETRRQTAVPAEATAHLVATDPTLAALVARIGTLEYKLEPDLWRSLVGSIIGQQLSVRAAATIRARIAALGSNGFPGPDVILAAADEDLRGCGLSRAKAGYVRDLAHRYLAGEIDPSTLRGLPDEEVIQDLVRVRGVGRWTAEMVLIFCLGRPDVLAVDDLGIRTAVQRAYGLDERPGGPDLVRIGDAWRPFRSYASLYLWESLKV